MAEVDMTDAERQKEEDAQAAEEEAHAQAMVASANEQLKVPMVRSITSWLMTAPNQPKITDALQKTKTLIQALMDMIHEWPAMKGTQEKRKTFLESVKKMISTVQTDMATLKIGA